MVICMTKLIKEIRVIVAVALIALCMTPLQASITGNRMIADELVGEMTEVKMVFCFCSEFHSMLKSAQELRAKAYDEFAEVDEVELRRQLLQLEAQFKAYLKNMAQERWCLPYEG
jgi:hypothetical protein